MHACYEGTIDWGPAHDPSVISISSRSSSFCFLAISWLSMPPLPPASAAVVEDARSVTPLSYADDRARRLGVVLSADFGPIRTDLKLRL